MDVLITALRLPITDFRFQTNKHRKSIIEHRFSTPNISQSSVNYTVSLSVKFYKQALPSPISGIF